MHLFELPEFYPFKVSLLPRYVIITMNVSKDQVPFALSSSSHPHLVTLDGRPSQSIDLLEVSSCCRQFLAHWGLCDCLGFFTILLLGLYFTI